MLFIFSISGFMFFTFEHFYNIARKETNDSYISFLEGIYKDSNK